MQIKTIIFDLDGTLLDTLQDLVNATNMALTDFGYPARTYAEIRTFVGNGNRRLMELSLPEGTANPQFEDVFARFKEHYAAHQTDNTKPYPGIEEAIGRVQKAGIKTAIVSNKVDSAVQDLNEQFFHIDVAIGDISATLPAELVETAPKRKPAPDLVLLAMERLGASPDSTVYVGDSDVDLATAKNSGLPCLTCTWGFRDKEDLVKNGAVNFVNNAKEMADWILERA